MTYSIPRPPQFHLRVRKGTSGLGLFAEQAIPKGRFIIEYYGKIVSDDEAQEIGGRYLFELGNGKTIEGSMRENTARYANHSCKPNSEVRIKGSRVFLFSLKNIKEGEEIVYDYGKEYHNHFIKPYGCRCQSCEKKTKQKTTR
jgi:SET domain-containing protein